MGDSTTKPLPSWTRQLPRSKREVAIANTKLASREEFENMGVSALIVQYKKRETHLRQMIAGVVYEDNIADEMERILELIDGCRHGYSESPQELR